MKTRGFRCGLAAIVLAMLVPTLLTWVYFVAMADRSESAQQLTYSVGKVIQFGFPIFFINADQAGLVPRDSKALVCSKRGRICSVGRIRWLSVSEVVLGRRIKENGSDLTWQFGGKRVMSIMREPVIGMVILALVIILWMKGKTPSNVMHQSRPRKEKTE